MSERFLKATRETWEHWLGGVGRSWSPTDLSAAERLIELVDAYHRSTDDTEKRRLTQTIRTGERDLGLRQPKGKPNWLRSEMRIVHALDMDKTTARRLLLDHPDLTVERIVRSRRPDWVDPAWYGFYEKHGHYPTDGERLERAVLRSEVDRSGAGGRWSRDRWERAFPGARYPAEIYEDPDRHSENEADATAELEAIHE